MAELESTIYTRLSSYAGLTALLSTRVYPLRLPQGATLPAVVYQRVSGTRVYSHQGDSGLGRARIQVDCWATTYASAKAVAAQVKLALSGYANATIGYCHLVGERDLSEPETGNYRVVVDFMIGYSE